MGIELKNREIDLPFESESKPHFMFAAMLELLSGKRQEQILKLPIDN